MLKKNVLASNMNQVVWELFFSQPFWCASLHKQKQPLRVLCCRQGETGCFYLEIHEEKMYIIKWHAESAGGSGAIKSKIKQTLLTAVRPKSTSHQCWNKCSEATVSLIKHDNKIWCVHLNPWQSAQLQCTALFSLN